MALPCPQVLSRNWSSSLGRDSQAGGQEELELDYGEDDLFISSDESFAPESSFDAHGATHGALNPQGEKAPSSSEQEYSSRFGSSTRDFVKDPDLDQRMHAVEEGEVTEGKSINQVGSSSSSTFTESKLPLDGDEGNLPRVLSAAQRSRKQNGTVSGTTEGEKRKSPWREAGKKRPGPYDRYKQEVAFNRPPPGKLRAWDEDIDIKPFNLDGPMQPPSRFISAQQARRSSFPPTTRMSPRTGRGFNVQVYPSPPPSASERMPSFDYGGQPQQLPFSFQNPPPSIGMQAPSGPASMRRQPPAFGGEDAPPTRTVHTGMSAPLGNGHRPGPYSHPQQRYRRTVSETNSQPNFRRPLPPQEACAPPPPPHLRIQPNPCVPRQTPPFQRPGPPQQQSHPPHTPRQQYNQQQQYPQQPPFYSEPQQQQPFFPQPQQQQHQRQSMPFPRAPEPNVPFLNPAVATVALQMGLQLIAGAMQSQQQAMASMSMEGGPMGLGMGSGPMQPQPQQPPPPPQQQQQQMRARNGPPGRHATDGGGRGGISNGARRGRRGQGQFHY